MRQRDRDSGDGTDDRRRHLTELQTAELHVTDEERHLGRPQGGHEEAHRERCEERTDGGLVVEARQWATERDAGECEKETDARTQPKDGRTVPGVQFSSLDQRRTQGVVGEDDDEAREDDHHRREAPVVRGEQPGEDERDDHARDLEQGLRAGLPRESTPDPGPDRVQRAVRLRRRAHAGTGARGIAASRKLRRSAASRLEAGTTVAGALLELESLTEPSSLLDERHEPGLGEAMAELQLVVVDRLAEHLPTRDDDRALAVCRARP